MGYSLKMALIEPRLGDAGPCQFFRTLPKPRENPVSLLPLPDLAYRIVVAIGAVLESSHDPC